MDGSGATPRAADRRSARRATAAVFAVVFLAHARLIGGGWAGWDNTTTIVANPRLAPPTWAAVGYYWRAAGADAPGQLYVPLTYTVWAGLAWLGGGRPVPELFHGANVLLHAAAAAATFRLLFRLFRRVGPAAVGALAFGLHPAQVEAVGWASGTKDVLGGGLAVAGLLAYVGAVDGGRFRPKWYVVGAALYGLAMLAKPGAVVVPGVAAALDGLVLGRPWRAVLRAAGPWAALAVPCLAWTAAAQPAGWAEPVPVWARPLVATDAVAFDVGKVLWPARLGLDYGRRPAGVLASGAARWDWVVPAALVGVAAWASRRPATRPVAAAVAAFVVAIGPVSGLVPFEFQYYSTVADHYLYLPMLGVAVAAAWAAGRWRGAARATGVLLAVWGVRSVVQEGVWHDTVALAEHAAAVNPDSWAAHDLLGDAFDEAAFDLRNAGRPAEAAEMQRRALAEYAAEADRNRLCVPALLKAAGAAGRLGRGDERRAWLARVVAVQPRLPPFLRMDPAGLARVRREAGVP